MNRKLRKTARKLSHVEMMTAFTAFLEKHWPLWRAHEGESRYHDLLKAFKAGYEAA